MSEREKTRVLFVDDEPNILFALRRMLHSMRKDWEMGFASGGPEALELMKKQPFDVVVSDMRMPRMTGAKLLEEVARRYPTTVRFILSGQSDRETILRSVGCAHQYMSKPCDAEVIRSTVARAFALRGVLGNASLIQLVSRIRSIPSLPDVYVKLQEAIRSEDSSLKVIGEIIERDVGMSAKVLQLVNSAFFGLRRPASTPGQAVNLLGLDVVRALTLVVAVFDKAEDPGLPGLSLRAIQDHSLAVGAYAKTIARSATADRQGADDAHMAGVLHDVGLLLLATNRPQEYRRVLDSARDEEIEILEAERAVFGATHAEVGAYVLGLWGLPDPIVEAVAFHHAPRECLSEQLGPLAAVHFADVMDHELRQVPLGAFESRLDEEYFELLGVADRLPEWRGKCLPFETEEESA